MKIDEDWVTSVVNPAKQKGMKLRSILIGSGSGSTLAQLKLFADEVQVSSEMSRLNEDILGMVQGL